MKTLTLLRHAKSGWDDTVARDFDRPLNEKGKRAASAMGAHLKARGVVWDHVVASPAVRVTETLDQFVRGYGRTLAPGWDRRCYLASAATLLDVIREQDDAHRRLLLVGHNPGLEELALMLVPDGAGNGLRRDVEDKYPTAAVTEISFAIDRWSDAAAGGGTLARFTRPRDLDPMLGPDDD